MTSETRGAPPAGAGFLEPGCSAGYNPQPMARFPRQALLRWYDRTRRDLPWRRTPGNAYRQWLAESMLQQTQVATVLPYYAAFVRRFPRVQDLAAAPLDDVLTLWAGLGYYARARHLHRAARRVHSEFNNRFPDTVAGLMALPGVGRYTAGAVASIAFGRRAPILDGNVKRVLCRCFGIRDDISRPAVIDHLWQVAEAILPRRRCGDFNQALMELGALICRPRAPDCPSCPLRRQCAAAAGGAPDELPSARRRAKPAAETWQVAAIRHGPRYLLRRRPVNALWGGLWELPSGPAAGGTLRQLVAAVLPANARLSIPGRPGDRLVQRLTHKTLELQVYYCVSRSAHLPVRSGRRLKWVHPRDFRRFACPRAQQRIFERVMQHTGAADGR